MIAVIQRVSQATLHIEGALQASIQQGFLVLLGIHVDDTPEDVAYLAGKITGLRVFSDEEPRSRGHSWRTFTCESIYLVR
jgi:D-tyrosyl-tRNA(Tyr) deacylase